jgi:putative ABC transport system ATP-binding protein
MIAPAAVRFEQVRKVYEGAVPQHALRGVSLAVAPRSFCVIEGPSGSGKTTLLAIAGGLERPTDGHVWVSGQEISALSPSKLLAFRRAELAFVFQDFKLIDVLTAEENVALVLTLRGIAGAEALRRSRELLERLGLAARLKGRPVELSGGEKQRVAIARALVAEPRVLLADEPTANLDWENGQGVVELLRGASRERGTTVVVVSHDSRLGALADERIRIADGSVNGACAMEDGR